MLTLSTRCNLKSPSVRKNTNKKCVCSGSGFNPEDLKKQVNKSRTTLETERKSTMKQLHEDIINISKKELGFARKIADEIFPPSGFDKIREFIMPSTSLVAKPDEPIVIDDDYFDEQESK